MSLFGFTSSQKASQSSKEESTGARNSSIVFDVTSKDFEAKVLKASLQRPVVVDFWAPWCGPCKQLMPLLQAEIDAAQGMVLLAKVNIDACPDLAQVLRIQSVPTVMVFFQGQPVSAFSGARPQSEIRALIAQLVQMAKAHQPGALDIPHALKEATDHLNRRDFPQAEALYAAVLEQDDSNVSAYAGLVRIQLELANLEMASAFLKTVPEALQNTPEIVSVRTALELAREGQSKAGEMKELYRKLEELPDDKAVRFDLACAQFAVGEKAAAIENLLLIVSQDRGWNDEAARKELLRYFEALGFSDPLSIQGRKKLSSLLFS